MPTWKEIVANNPQHSKNYAERWDRLAAQGMDILGEARLVDALAPRGAKILDAGCGQGRIGGYLAEQGHEVLGVDLDPYLIECAQQRYPQAEWKVVDLSLPGAGEGAEGNISVPADTFDLAICAGNVITFIEPANRVTALTNLATTLRPGGRLLLGFGAGRGYPFGQCLEDLPTAGLEVEQTYGTWQLDPLRPTPQQGQPASDFLVVIARKPLE